jgi:hypothetical protein
MRRDEARTRALQPEGRGFVRSCHLLRFFAGFGVGLGTVSSIVSRPRSTANRNTTERDSRPTTKMSLLLRSVGMSASARCRSDLGKRRVTMLESAIGSFLRNTVHAKLVTCLFGESRTRGAALPSGTKRDCSSPPPQAVVDIITLLFKRALFVCRL